MSDPSTSPTIEALLEHSSWVRTLARRLASGADAEDLEQRTWLAALAPGPRPGVPAREWLASVLRNFARQQRRSDRRRAEREQRAARPEACSSTLEVLANLELHRRLVATVMELDEPYRTTILLRYSEGLPPREVARRLGVPVATVRTRVARAIDRLRGRLDREHGGNRDAWIAAFTPLLHPPIELAPPAPLALLAMMPKTSLFAAAALVLAAAGWLYVRDTGPSAAQVPSIPVRPNEPSGAVAATRPSAIAPEAARELVPEGARSAVETASVPASPAAPPPARTVRGRVLDASGAVATGVELIVLGSGEKTQEARTLISDESGRFVIEDPPDSGRVTDGDPRLSTVLRGSFRAGQARESVVIVAPRIDLAGEVVDEAGEPLEGVGLGVELPEDFRSRFAEVLDSSIDARWSSTSAAGGRFELDDLPAVDGASLSARSSGFRPWSALLPGKSDTALRIVLERPLATDGLVRGRVVDGHGAPIHDARVALGIDTVLTPDDGSFAFEIDDPNAFSARVGFPRDALVAIKEGLLPARYAPPVTGGEPAWPSSVTLRLDGPALAVSGTVVGADREPLSGIRVFVIDSTLFGAVDGRPAMLENLLAGSGERVWSWVETDAQGRFEVGGLLDRDYVLRAHDPSTLLRTDSEPVRAGSTGVRLELPTDQLFPRVAGRITSFSGRPIVGASVFPMCDAFQVRALGQILSTSHDAVEGTRTDEDGRFELADVPKSLVYLRIEGERILPLEYGRYVEGDPRFADSEVRELPRDAIESLAIQVELRCHVQVELADPNLADEVAFLDSRGRELVVSLFVGEGRRDGPRHDLSSGRSAVLGVPDTAVTVVLFAQGAEVARVAIEPDPTRVTTVRL